MFSQTVVISDIIVVTSQLHHLQGRIHVWSESAPPPPFWQINHANSAYFRLFLGYFGVISATRPPPFWISAPPPFFTYPGSSPDLMTLYKQFHNILFQVSIEFSFLFSIGYLPSWSRTRSSFLMKAELLSTTHPKSYWPRKPVYLHH